MRRLLTSSIASLLVALSAVLICLYPGRETYIISIIIYIILLNEILVERLAGRPVDEGAILLGSLIVLFSTLKLINFYGLHLIDLGVATVVTILAATNWSEELLKAQYTPFYPLSMMLALILGYFLDTVNPLQLVLLSILESHLIYHALSSRQTYGESIELALYTIIIYSFFISITRKTQIIPLLIITTLLKIASSKTSRLVQLYAPLDLYLKVLIGGIWA